MNIEIFVFFESVNQNLSFHVHNVEFLSQEPLKKLSRTFSINDILSLERPKSRLSFRALVRSPKSMQNKTQTFKGAQVHKGPKFISKAIRKCLSPFHTCLLCNIVKI